MLKAIKYGLVLAIGMNAACAETSTQPLVKFEEGEQMHVSLSSMNFNRIVVEGEDIVKVSFPEGSFIIEKTTEEEEFIDGSVSLKPVAHIPLTVFLTTNRNHHFSITVKPDESEGSTLKFVAKGLRGYEYAKAKEQNHYEVDEVLGAMMEGKKPEGYKEVRVTPSTFQFQKHLKMTLVKQYQGLGQSGYVYRVENRSKEPIELNALLFENAKLVSMDVSNSTLAPNQSGYFYGIYRDNQSIG